MAKEFKSIKIPKKQYKRLKKMKREDEAFYEVIDRLIKSSEEVVELSVK